MPESDPFDDLRDLLANREAEPAAPPGYSPTRKEAVVPPSAIRTPTRAERIPPSVPQSASPPADNAAVFRPSHRAPLGLLTVFDDGVDTGETIRIRQARFVIGRTQGDFNLPFDERVSPRHAEIVRELKNGKHIWHLTDLKSETGTFVWVAERPLTHATELILGSQTYTFEPNAASGSAMLRSKRDDNVIHLHPPMTTIGRLAPPSDLTLADDPCLSSAHARFDFEPATGWKVVSLGGRNGVWVRVDRVRLSSWCKFQLGEQRFHLRVLS